MRAFYLKHPWLCAGAFAGLLLACSSVVHPFGAPKQSDQQKTSGEGLEPSPEVAAVLKRSCMDCHSNQTVWPWYSYMAPVSWLVERDVRRGRDHLNLSEWPQYTFQQKQELLADIATAVKNGEMPLRQYTLIHRRARLSEADTDMVYTWARAERRRLRAASPLALQPSRQRGLHK
ncbi:MAG: heme-binding domain-containing protein [Acidobacteriaceae bacterium]|nr:heme-binding domain-containing protein [Acidobacteriaceae bacterium]MBV9033292.1 heme-binding domain-containing protein [Acidobacteriaceae bacterium]MBV9222478.1 heme-binding domain-containing protein [Acidobacteriaceae bacterium]MBV9307691.1 heme-binding domain-containing protein [Acidobacteriaceae bacterium]MBV9676531.1 heme-binding domain-containing protein [Acidobacteriaceae bacterium]